MSFSALKGLEELTLHNWYNVNRTLDINNIILFPSLKSLSLENLGLESISSGVGSTTLQYLSLRNNVISGALPSAIGNFINIVDVHVDNNNLYSSSNPFPVLNSLRKLTASHNSLSGQVPASLAVPNLTFLDLSSNSGLRGALPSSFQAIPTTHNLTINLNQTCVNTTGFSRPASSGAVTTIITANLTRQCSGNYDDYEGSHEFDGLR
ncbi:hypothetical protein DFJ73DRAFT_830817 [Zopfochytrium polystomum]|nr:hypothetical protein DFJ73DRAFT_830817 [Zopfochytrium polystomum]